MRKAIKKAAALLLALVLSMGSAACAKEQAPALSEEAAEVLVYGSGDYTAINPALYEHGEINLLLFAGLMAHNGQNEVVPDVAETWEYDAKNCTYTFKLRRDVYFHDGHPLTSRDVRFTLQAIMDPKNASENASNYEDILEIETPDDYTVILFLAAPNVVLLDYLTIGILPAHLLEGKDLALDSFNQNPVGAGPYRLEQWDMGQSITLKKHEQYHRGEPKIDEIIFKIVEDTQARALQLQSGELDLAQVTPEDAQMFRQGQHSSLPFSRMLPSSRQLPGHRRIRLRQRVVFPEPDSPTMARVSPVCTPKETPLTAQKTPSSAGKPTLRFSTSRRAMLPPSCTHAPRYCSSSHSATFQKMPTPWCPRTVSSAMPLRRGVLT